MTESLLPGNAAYYDRHIYPRLDETVPIGPGDPPSTLIDWFLDAGIVREDDVLMVLEVGCGAGRNLRRLRQRLPHAAIHGFDGSPLALRMARASLPGVDLRHGDIHAPWPFGRQFDLVADITVGLPESVTQQELERYGSSLWSSLTVGGLAVVEGLSTGDPSSRRFGSGTFVTWEHDGETKKDRLISLEHAVGLYERWGFEMIEARLARGLDSAFSDRCDVEHETVQLVLRKAAG